MNILITGASGMLGATLVSRLNRKHSVFATDLKNFKENPIENFMAFDLQTPSYKGLINWSNPDVILHCAAITNVDYCEQNPVLAMSVNGESTRKLAESAPGAYVLFISSDAVFPDGIFMANEQDKTAPETIYGKSKVAGELHLKNSGIGYCIIRTTIVGKNINPSNQGFAEWIINTLKSGKTINLFEDAIFTPITIWHLADEIEFILENKIIGLFHISGTEPVSKYEFGLKIAEKLGINLKLVKKASIKNFHFTAKRSTDQTLNSSHYVKKFNRNLPGIDDNINRLIKKG